jgi:hypothetical protein
MEVRVAGRKAKSAAKKSQQAINRKIDEEVEESFPASDPPAFMGGKHEIGAPGKRRTPVPKRPRKTPNHSRKKT